MKTALGIKQFDDIQLKDFTWEIVSVRYDWKASKAYVEVHAWETHKVNSRTFEFDCATEWSAQDAINALMTLDCFSNSQFGTFRLGEIDYSAQTVIDGLVFHSKQSRNLNTAVDVYFEFNSVIYGIIFQDWNIFSVLSDQQCKDKLVEYLKQNGEIKHPANTIKNS